MRRFIFTLFLVFLVLLTVQAQSPEAFKYQAVVRDGSGQVINNQSVSFRISILANGSTGAVVYSETHSATTNAFGLANLEIGSGTPVSGDFSTIGWGSDPHFVRVELDVSGGSTYQELGTSQLLSVPYALHSRTADEVPGDNDPDPNNEFQDLSFSGTNLSISSGNSVNLSGLQDGVNDADADPGNELQDLSFSGTNLSISSGNSVNLSGLQDGVNDADSDPGNELQDLSFSGTNLSISSGNSVNLSGLQDGVNDADADPGNELQDLSFSGTNLSISSGNSVNLSGLQDGVNDADSDPVNEIQSLSLSGNSLSITGANNVDLSNVGQSSPWQESGSDVYYNQGDVGINQTAPEFDLHVDGELFVNTSIGRINLGLPNNGNQWRFSTQGSGANLQFQSKPSGSFTYTRRVFLSGSTGNVAIGNNSNPDEELVVGTNLGSGWSFPAITVGGTSGGAVQTGNTSYKISMESSSTFARARIISTSPTGFGRGEIEMRTNGLAIGENAGAPGSYMLKVEHGSFGINFARAGTANDWEILTSSATASNLNLYANGSFRGSFSGTDGTWNPSSDRSLKTNVRPMETVIPRLLKLEPSRYSYIDNNPEGKETIGFIAQEVKELFPELVLVVEDERSKGMHALNYSGLSTVTVKAIQEQQALIEAQAGRLLAQEAEIEDLKARLTAIEAALAGKE